MLTYNINARKAVPIYRYVYDSIREDILSGRLPSGARLPSKRQMAADNGVSLITIENAYAQLLLEGYVEAVPRKGYFVADIEVAPKRKGAGTAGVTEPQQETSAQVAPAGRSRYDFTAGSVQSDSFPYATWAKLLRKVISDREQDFAQAPSSTGVYELRRAITGYLLNSKNLRVQQENIIIGPGTEYLHYVLLQLLGRNRLVAVEDPGYKKVGAIYESNGIKVMHIPVDKNGLRLEKLIDSNITLVHVSPAHHFPTGSVMPASHRHRLVNWAERQQAYIIEDDYDAEFRFKGRPLPTLMSLNDNQVIYMNTFTSSLAPSIRIAYMVLPERMMQLYRQKLSFLSGTVSTFEQLTLAAFISEGYYERHLSRMKNRYRKLKQAYAEAFTASQLAASGQILEDQAGIQFNLAIEGLTDTRAFLELLASRGILLRSEADYCYNTAQAYAGRFVLRYLELDKATITQIFNTMAACRAELR